MLHRACEVADMRRWLARSVLLAVATPALLHAQTPDQKQLAFEVASVKPNGSNTTPTAAFALGPGDAYVPGGLFTATNQPLIVYIRFAYKLSQSAQSVQSDVLNLPAWVYDERFDIAARAQGTPTKDQMRRMMQSLLSERFKLRLHTERHTSAIQHAADVRRVRAAPQRTGAHAD